MTSKANSKRGKKIRTAQSASKVSSVDLGLEGGDEIEVPAELPLLPSYDLVPFPSVIMALYFADSPTLSVLEQVGEEDGLVFVVAQYSESSKNGGDKEFFDIGVVARIVKVFRLADERYKVLMQGLVRAKALKYKKSKSGIVARIEVVEPVEIDPKNKEVLKLVANIRDNLQALVEYEHLPEEMLLVTEELDDYSVLSDVIVAHYKLDVNFGQSVLEELDPIRRLKLTDKIISDDLNRFLIAEKIKGKAQGELIKGQQEYYLREQLRQIQRELGESDALSEDLAEVRAALENAGLPEHASKEAFKQLSRLERMHPETSEYAMLRTYLEWICDIPWSLRTRDRLDLKVAKRILDQDHYGLERVKERILEYLSVRKLKKDSKGPILCFVGPPGVGKTSLGRSIARSLNRKFFRMSLGGVRDEAEIRGHRRTYVGALPGRIMQGLKEAASRNPVLMFDELDKIGADYRGDPAAALLEILDPEQNKAFRDHYLNIPFDLSGVLFIATANTLDTVPPALLDRLEVIYISGYTTEEKCHIAQQFLIPKQLVEQGLDKNGIKINKAAINFLIEHYTREAGVRNLEREIASLCRKLARQLVETGQVRKTINPEAVNELLGVTKFEPELSVQEDSIGLVHGLAWTLQGGELMPVEALTAKGKGQLNLTGHLGTVMQESAQAAVFYARANAERLGIDPDFNSRTDIHIHVPGGATPKDGPSAGVTIVTALVSALSGIKVSRDIAMTGEITLRGNVLPVGGIKEKALAALRYGIKKVIIPFDNKKDLDDIPEEQRKQISFITVKEIGEVLDQALCSEPQSKSVKMAKAAKKLRKKGMIDTALILEG